MIRGKSYRESALYGGRLKPEYFKRFILKLDLCKGEISPKNAARGTEMWQWRCTAQGSSL